MDPGDKYDSTKWDFPENSLEIFYIDGYPYKAYSEGNAEILHDIRLQINNMTELLNKKNTKLLEKIYISNKKNNKFSFEEFIEGIYLFIDVHGEEKRSPAFYKENPLFYKRKNYGTSSKYLLSEMPDRRLISGYPQFVGLNKPKERKNTHEYPIGNDYSIRATYRDVFLVIPTDVSNSSIKEFRELIIHELAHTMANHVRFRDNDHNGDFKQCDDLLTIVANETNFLKTR